MKENIEKEVNDGCVLKLVETGETTGDLLLKLVETGEATGDLFWYLNGKEIKITDKKMLMIAFMDTVSQMTDKNYDLSLLDKETYDEYQEFLKSAENKEMEKEHE